MIHNIEISLFRCNSYPLNIPPRVMHPHRHNSLEICYIMSGELILHYLSKKTNRLETISLFEKQLLLIKPDCLHYTEINPPLKTLSLEIISNQGELFNLLQH